MALKHIVIFGGETISIPQGTLNPWYVVGPLSAHGGELWASNNAASGAIFHFTLPTFSGEDA